MSRAFHLVLRPQDGSLVHDAPSRRRLASAVIRTLGQFGLLAFRCSDTHLHLLVVTDRPREAARRGQISLTRTLVLGASLATHAP